MTYEWDESKRISNLVKHGVYFEDIEAFDWDTAILTFNDVHAEPRWVAIGFIGRRLHVVVFTERGQNIRLISLRKASRQEARDYIERQT